MKRLVVLTLGALALVSCGKTSLAHKDAPDEFAISRNAPLIVPPDFALAPPKPGEPRPLGNDSQKAAAEALFGTAGKPPPKSAGEISLLEKAGASKPTVDIRSMAGDTRSVTVDKGVFVQELLGAQPGTTNAQVASVAIRP